MFSKGYRPSGSNQHISVVRFSELFLDEETIIIFDRMRRKRTGKIKKDWKQISSSNKDLISKKSCRWFMTLKNPTQKKGK